MMHWIESTTPQKMPRTTSGLSKAFRYLDGKPKRTRGNMMSTLSRLWRSTILITIVTTIWVLVYCTVLAIERQAALLSAIFVTVALAIAIGLLPGSYLQRPLDRGAEMATKASASVVTGFALGSPPILALCLGFGAFVAWDNLRVAQRYGLDAGTYPVLIPLFAAGAFIGLVFFARNLATFFRFRGQARGSTD